MASAEQIHDLEDQETSSDDATEANDESTLEENDEETASEREDTDVDEHDGAEAMEVDDDEQAERKSATSNNSNKVSLASKPLSSMGVGKKPSAQPKMRIKLSLKLPAKRKLPTATTVNSSSGDNDAKTTNEPGGNEEERKEDDELKVTVVDSDEAVDAVAVPTSPQIVAKDASNQSGQHGHQEQKQSSKSSKQKHFRKSLPIINKSAAISSSASSHGQRKAAQPSKQVRFPPIASPGLLLLRPPAGPGPKQLPQFDTGSQPLTAQQIFQTTMAATGYTYERRANQPHRGSSVERTVGDMFDTNVKLNLHPIELIPNDLWKATKKNEEGKETTLPNLLLQSFKKSKRKRQLARSVEDNKDSVKRQRNEPTPFQHMIPVSLTIPYPEEYIQRRLQYVEEVAKREKAIVEWQEAQEKLEIQREEQSDDENDHKVSLTNPVIIPPIPDPPHPPDFHEIVVPDENRDSSFPSTFPPYFHFDPKEQNSSEYPLYIPKLTEDFVAHLDKNCFHITEGRYFGLLSNNIADPNFVGANAPGLAGTNIAGGGNLATATTATSTSNSGLTGGGMTMILSASFHSAAAVPANRDSTTTSTGAKEKTAPVKSAVTKTKDTSSTVDKDETSSVKKEPSEEKKKKVVKKEPGKPATSTKKTSTSKSTNISSSAKLKAIMEDTNNKELAAKTKEAILRAAVEISRRQRYDKDTFRAPNGKVFSDLHRAFAIYSGIKPCERCKSNKQGVYHCRIRRRHREPDFDGGTTADILKPYFEMPLKESSKSSSKKSKVKIESAPDAGNSKNNGSQDEKQAPVVKAESSTNID